jgi:hypothetical protein
LFVYMAVTKSSDCNNSRTNLQNPCMVIIPTETQPGRNCRTHDGYIQQQKHSRKTTVL